MLSQKEIASRLTLNCLACDPTSWQLALRDDQITLIDVRFATASGCPGHSYYNIFSLQRLTIVYLCVDERYCQSHDETSLPRELREQMLARYPSAKRVRLLHDVEQ